MHSILFWKSWGLTERFLFWLMGTLLILLTLFFWRDYFLWPAPAITYEQIQQVQPIEVTSHSFDVGDIHLNVPAESYLLFESIDGSPIHPAVFSSYLLLTVLGVAFVFFLSIATELSRYRFLMAMGIIILFITSLQLDELAVFGLANKVPTVSLIIIFGLLSFYFHAIKTGTNFLYRLINFSVLTAVIGVITFYFSRTELPLLHLATNGLVSGISISVIFILTVSHEIVATFVTVISKSLKSQKSLHHFLILTTIYLVNLFLMLFSKMGVVQWSFFSVSPFFLLNVSAILGIWGFRQRTPVHEGILPNEPLRIFFFLSLAIISLCTLTYFVSAGSDMMMDAFEDIILAAHIGGGVIFALYVIANFAPMLLKNLPVYKVLYKPDTMPHFTFRLMAVIATFASISWAVPWKTYVNQTVASYYNAHGDLNLVTANEQIAEIYFQRSLRFRNQNLHAHYAMASIYTGKNEPSKARKEYEKALIWGKSVPAYLNLSQILAQQGDQLEAALTLDEARKKIPKSGELTNALALSYLNLKIRDSALHFFREALKSKSTEVVAKTNLLATSVWYNIKFPIDTLISLDDFRKNGVKANMLAMANLKQQKLIADQKFQSDTTLNIYEASTLSNYLINQREEVDTVLISKAIKLAMLPSNDYVSDQLLVSSAQALYAKGQVSRAMKIVREAAFNSGNANEQVLMGLWLLEQNNPLLAMSYFKKAAENKYANALYYLAIAETEADSLHYAVYSWDSLSKSKDRSIAAFAEKMKKVLTSKNDLVSKFSNDEKYYFCRYRISLNDSLLFQKTLSEISDERFHSQAIIDRTKKWFALDETSKAFYLLNQLPAVFDKRLRKQIDELSLLIAASRQDWKFISEKLATIEVDANLKIYLEALIAQQNGNLNLATQKWEYLTRANDQFEEGKAGAFLFFAGDTTNQLKNFSQLVEGLLAKPTSVKILKLHAVAAANLSFYDASQESLDKLHWLLPKRAFEKYLLTHKDLFSSGK